MTSDIESDVAAKIATLQEQVIYWRSKAASLQEQLTFWRSIAGHQRKGIVAADKSRDIAWEVTREFEIELAKLRGESE